MEKNKFTGLIIIVIISLFILLILLCNNVPVINPRVI